MNKVQSEGAKLRKSVKELSIEFCKPNDKILCCDICYAIFIRKLFNDLESIF